eukprot:1145920-Pelagomonas_calceolata.AAC.2
MPARYGPHLTYSRAQKWTTSCRGGFKGYKGYNGKRPQSRRLTASLFINAHEIMKRWILNILRSPFEVKSTTPSWSILREYGIEAFQFNWFRATMRFYNLLT